MSALPYTVVRQPLTTAPWVSQTPPDRYYYVKSQIPNQSLQSIHQPMETIGTAGSKPSFFKKHYVLLTCLSGLCLLILVGVAVGAPLAQAFVEPAKTTLTTTTTTSATTTTTTSTTTTTEPPLLWNSTGTTVAGSLTSTTATPLYIYFPIGMHIDANDILYVCDSRNHRIQKFMIGNTTGTTVAGQSTGSVGTGLNYLNYPSDVDTDSTGAVYVADSTNNRIMKWPVGATTGSRVAGNGSVGSSTWLLNAPRSLTYDSGTNTLYVSDGTNHRILMFRGNSTNGTVVAGGNGQGNTQTQLNSPRGVVYDASTNSLIIVNNGCNNVVRWVIGASSWTLMAGNLNGLAGNSSTALNGPWDLTMDPYGNIYVADRLNHRIQFFRAYQSNGTTIAGVSGSSGTTAARLQEPLGVALDSQLNLYVADATNNRIQKFSRY